MKRRDFWSTYQPGFRAAKSPIGSTSFFNEVTEQRYELEPHIPEMVRFTDWAGCRVLEAGCGIGTDGARFARAGARYTGLDFSMSAPALARRRFELERLNGQFVAGSVSTLPFRDATFDLVFSHGVVHHVPDTEAAISEFHRVLKPGGTVLVMLYHRRSLNYYFTILVLRRALVALLLIPGASKLLSKLTREPEDVLSGHGRLLKEHGARYIMNPDLFLSHNTDGPGNPLSKVYSREQGRSLLESSKFQNVQADVRYLNLRLYPGGTHFSKTRMAKMIEHRVGWHLYLRGRKLPLPDAQHDSTEARCNAAE